MDVDDLQITEVSFDRLFNIGQYENIKIGLVARVGPMHTAQEVVIALDKHVTEIFRQTKRAK